MEGGCVTDAVERVHCPCPLSCSDVQVFEGRRIEERRSRGTLIRTWRKKWFKDGVSNVESERGEPWERCDGGEE